MSSAEAYAKGPVQKERTGIEKSQSRVGKILARTGRRCPSECFLSSTSGLCFYTLRRKRPLLTEVLFIGSCCGLRFHEPLPCSCIARGERMDMWEPRAEPERREGGM